MLEARSPEFESGSVTELLRDLRQVPLCLWTCHTACMLGKGRVGEKSVCSMIYIWGSWARDEKGKDFWLQGWMQANPWRLGVKETHLDTLPQPCHP